MAKKKNQATPVPEEVVQQPITGMQDFELWDVTVKTTFKLDNDYNKIKIETPVKKGDAPIRVTRIEQRHADELNSQFVNTKQYYYLKDAAEVEEQVDENADME